MKCDSASFFFFFWFYWFGVVARCHESYCHRKRVISSHFRAYIRPSCWYSRRHFKKSQQSSFRPIYLREFIRFNEVRPFYHWTIPCWLKLLQICCRCLSSSVAKIWAGFVRTFPYHPWTGYRPYVMRFVFLLIENSLFLNRICSLCFPSPCPNAWFTDQRSSSQWIPKHPHLPAHTRKLAAEGKHSWPSPATEGLPDTGQCTNVCGGASWIGVSSCTAAFGTFQTEWRLGLRASSICVFERKNVSFFYYYIDLGCWFGGLGSRANLQQYLKPILLTLLTRMQANKTDKFVYLFTRFILYTMAINKEDFTPDHVIRAMEEIQPQFVIRCICYHQH